MKRFITGFLAIVVFCGANLFAAESTHDVPEFVKTGDTCYALFHINGDESVGYTTMAVPLSPIILAKIEQPAQSDENAEEPPPISFFTPEEAEPVLFSIYTQINLDEILQKLKGFDDEKFNAAFPILYLISEQVATVSDKRKIMDLFMERFSLKLTSDEVRLKARDMFSRQWTRFYITQSPLLSCFGNYAIEYVDYLGGITNHGDMRRAVVHMLQNNIYAAPRMLADAEKPNVPAEVKILYYIYSSSVLGGEQKIKVRESRLADLKKALGESHSGIRTAEIQNSILAGDLRPEFAEELREIVDKNYEIVLPLAIEYARKTKAWDDLAYYAYRCLKRDVFGIQKQLKSEHPSPYFDYLEFTLEGLAKTDPQAAGTLYEFVLALPKTTKQNFWLARAERILNGVDYDKTLAQNDGAVMAKKGFYENDRLEARFRESFEKRLKQN